MRSPPKPRLLGVPLVLQLNIVSAIGRGATVELRAAGTAPWAVRRRGGKAALCHAQSESAGPNDSWRQAAATLLSGCVLEKARGNDFHSYIVLRYNTIHFT